MMETLIEIGKIILFILLWFIGRYVWGSVKNRKGWLLRQLVIFWLLKKLVWLVAVDCLTQRGNSATLQFPRFALLCFFLGLYRTSARNHLFQFLRWYSYRAVNRCSGFLRALQSSSIWQPYTKLPSVGVAYMSAPCGLRSPPRSPPHHFVRMLTHSCGTSPYWAHRHSSRISKFLVRRPLRSRLIL